MRWVVRAGIAEGRGPRPAGSFPGYANGGGLWYIRPGMYGMLRLVEAVKQLCGERGERQVAGTESAIRHGIGGRLSASAILSTER